MKRRVRVSVAGFALAALSLTPTGCGKKEAAAEAKPADPAAAAAAPAPATGEAKAAEAAAAPAPAEAPKVDHLAAAKAKLEAKSYDDVAVAFTEAVEAIEVAASDPANPALLVPGQEIADVAARALMAVTYPPSAITKDEEKAELKRIALARIKIAMGSKPHVRAFLADNGVACGLLFDDPEGQKRLEEVIQQGDIGVGAPNAAWNCRFQSAPRNAAAKSGGQFDRKAQLAKEAEVLKGVVPPAVQSQLMGGAWMNKDVAGSTEVADTVIAALPTFNSTQQDVAVAVLKSVCSKPHIEKALEHLKPDTSPAAENYKKQLTEAAKGCK